MPGEDNQSGKSYEGYPFTGLALDPIHVGTGGARLGRVDLTIVRDPVTRIPKIPGSSLAGVYRTYVAMVKGKYPDCAGQGQAEQNSSAGHCGRGDCPICTVFGFSRGQRGGFAGLAAFSDAHVLLFPVATREGPIWITCPDALRLIGCCLDSDLTEDAVYRAAESSNPLNLGWLLLPVKKLNDGQWPGGKIEEVLGKGNEAKYIAGRMGIVPDKLFGHVVNSNLEVRTSVAIDPTTGAAEDGALFTYEALPRTTVLIWEVTCRNPAHFQINNQTIQAVQSPDKVHEVVQSGNPYLEHLGIGGMGTRGMGRLRVLACCGSQTTPASSASTSQEAS